MYRESSMARHILSLFSSVFLALVSSASSAEELPIRRPGLWELKIVKSDWAIPAVTLQQCTSEATDREIFSGFSLLARWTCSRWDVQKSASGYVVASVCSVPGLSVTSRAEVEGEFGSAYRIVVTSHREGGPPKMPCETVSIREDKWIGDCKSGQRPGDVFGSFGLIVNELDIENLRRMPSDL
jgi:hypothetical protein